MKSEFEKVNTACLIILAATAITAVLVFTRVALVPFVFSLFIFSVALPLIDYLQTRFRMPRMAAIIVSLILFLVFSGLVFFLVFSSLENFFQSANLYKSRVLELVGSIADTFGGWGFKVDQESVRNYLSSLPLFSYARNITGGAVSFIANSALIVVFVMFLLLGKKDGEPTHPLVQEIQGKISSYVATKLSVSILTGVAVGLLLWICDVELALMFAILTVLLNFIPNVGSMVATLLPLPVIFLQFGIGWQFIIVLVVSASIQFSIGNVIEPKLMGDSMDLHPVAVLVFLVFWGLVWGIPGLFLAVPITAVLKIALSRIPATRTVSEVLAGRLPKSSL